MATIKLKINFKTLTPVATIVVVSPEIILLKVYCKVESVFVIMFWIYLKSMSGYFLDRLLIKSIMEFAHAGILFNSSVRLLMTSGIRKINPTVEAPITSR